MNLANLENAYTTFFYHGFDPLAPPVIALLFIHKLDDVNICAVYLI